MSRVSTYLNFPGTTEAAFEFYKSVFGTEYEGPLMRMGDIPPQPGMPSLNAEQAKLVMHIALPCIGGHLLMGTDAVESLGKKLTAGTNVHISLQPDTREETERLFSALAAGGEITMPLQDMFWGAYYGALTDKFGIQWMFNCPQQQ